MHDLEASRTSLDSTSRGGQVGGDPLLDGGGGGGRGGIAGRLQDRHDGLWAASGHPLLLALAGSRPRLISCI